MGNQVDNQRNILLVEDEESIRFMLQTKLMKSGYSVTTAANGLHAIQIVRSGKTFDLILCDLKMPGQNGLDFFIELRKRKVDTPLVILTGFPEKEKILHAIRHGVRDVLLKPMPHAELISKIQDYLQDPGPESEAA